MSPKKDLASVFADPEWLPAHWDQAGGAIQFAHVPRRMHAELTFLSDQYLRDIHPPLVSASLAEAAAASAASTAPHYIFHSAFCCSTLLTRALDAPGIALALNEPQIVNELAAAALQRKLSSEVLQAVTRLLGRPFGPGESVVIKPSNEVNVLAPALLDDQRSRALFLYAPLPRFLKSVSNKGMWGRIWGRRLFAQLSARSGAQLGFASDAERFELTDLQVVALAWLLHHAEALELITRFPGRIRTLDSETFLARKGDTLVALARHFSLDADGKRWHEVADGPVFQSHSKEIGRSFELEGRSDDRPTPVIDEEIQMVMTWAQAVAQHAGLTFELPADAALVAPVV